MKSIAFGIFILATVSLLPRTAAPAPPLPMTPAAATEDPCSVANLPAGVQDLLKKDFPSMRPQQMSELSARDQKIWMQAHAKECPGIAVGHFERKTSLSYAFLLVAASDPAGGYKFVVFTKIANGNTYSSKLLNEALTNIDSRGLTISRVPPGKYTNYQKTKTITATLDCILLQWLDAGTDLFYYSGGKYPRLNMIE
jgi:hypothetical protein